MPRQQHAVQQYGGMAWMPGNNGINAHVPIPYPVFPPYQQGSQQPGVMIRPADNSELALARQAHRDKNMNQYPQEQAPAVSDQHGRIKMNKKMMGLLFE